MHTVLVVGATRGLGLALTKKYALRNGSTVLATSRSKEPGPSITNVKWIKEIDLGEESAGAKLATACKSSGPIDTLIIPAGYFATETIDNPKWAEEIKMYTISSIGPIFIVHHLVKDGLMTKGSKIILLSSESGSITLRHEIEGGGNYGHHGSKAALNMVGKLLSMDLKDKGISVGILHPAFMRTEMTKGVGFDKYWDDGGAVTPDVAAGSLVEFIDKFDMSMTGEYWAPRGAGDIGTAEAVLGKGLPTPLKLPW